MATAVTPVQVATVSQVALLLLSASVARPVATEALAVLAVEAELVVTAVQVCCMGPMALAVTAETVVLLVTAEKAELDSMQ